MLNSDLHLRFVAANTRAENIRTARTVIAPALVGQEQFTETCFDCAD